MNTINICFCGEIRKNTCIDLDISVAMTGMQNIQTGAYRTY